MEPADTQPSADWKHAGMTLSSSSNSLWTVMLMSRAVLRVCGARRRWWSYSCV